MTPIQLFTIGVTIWITVLTVLYLREAARRERLQEQIEEKRQVEVRVENVTVKVEVDIENLARINNAVRRQTGLSFEEVLERAIRNEISKAVECTLYDEFY